MDSHLQRSPPGFEAPGDGEPASSARRLRLIIDTIPTLAWCCRADGSTEFFNRRWLDYTGMSAERARDWGWTDALHPDDVGPVSEQWRTIVASAAPGELEARLRRSDGEYRWFLFRAAPALDDQGRVVNWCGTNVDIEDRKCAEDALRRSEQGFRLIVDGIPAFFATMSAAGDVEFVNQRILDYLGTTLEQLKSEDWSLAIHPDDREPVLERWFRSVETGEPYEIEHRVRRADGVFRWFHLRGVALRDADGRIVRWFVVLSDIEDRKRAEDTLRENERRLRVLFESIPGMITVHGADGALEYVNERLLDYLGTDFDTLVRTEWASVLHPDETEALASAWRRSLDTDQPMDVTLRMRRADGVFRWCHSRKDPIFDAQGRIVRWYSLVWDVDEQKQAEMALRASERELGLLVDNFPGMVTVFGPRGHLEYANQRALDFVGKDLAELTAWTDFIHPTELPAAVEEWVRRSTAGQPIDITYRLRRFDGAFRWVHSRTEPLFDERGDVLRWYGLIVDVDDQRNAEEALRSSQAELAHAARVMTMGELTASIAHEVNQPLSAVVNNANACLSLLPDDTPHLEDVREALSDIVGDADRASAVIARVRQLARKAPLERTLLDLKDVVADVLALARYESATRRVTIRTDLPDDLPQVSGDRVQLQQVLLNLVVNGMDAMSTIEESERVLTIGGGRETRPSGAEVVVVRVQDRGIGFSSDQRERLFEAFYTTKPYGMGMGLALSRSIIAAHGGRLGAEPNDGAGATFALSLPMQAASAPPHGAGGDRS